MTNTAGSTGRGAVAWILSAEAVRTRAHALLEAAGRGETPGFAVRPEALEEAADLVAEVTRRHYPDLDVPYHSRWRHFVVGGTDRWAALAARLDGVDADELARVRFDLAVVSVLLDAGAGDFWRYRDDASGLTLARSEGLAIASFAMVEAGAFADDPAGRPLSADAAALARVTPETIAAGFQVGPNNPLVGLEGRAALLQRLGAALAAAPELFGTPGRVGALYDHLKGQAADGALPATAVLAAVLRGLGLIWPGRIVLEGVNLGDVWRHPLARAEGPTDGLVPFHKLSQWLTYSLVEPLEGAGIRVTGLDALTGLPEYRNGGLLIDTGVLVPRDEAAMGRAFAVDDPLIVEWRALTVALLDRLADPVRRRLGVSAEAFPLARMLQGGSWTAGREIARRLRPDGGPPIAIRSDGTVF